MMTTICDMQIGFLFRFNSRKNQNLLGVRWLDHSDSRWLDDDKDAASTNGIAIAWIAISRHKSLVLANRLDCEMANKNEMKLTVQA